MDKLEEISAGRKEPRQGRVCQCTVCRGPDSWLRRTESASRRRPQERNRPGSGGMVRRLGDGRSLLPRPRLLTSRKRCQLKEMWAGHYWLQLRLRLKFFASGGRTSKSSAQASSSI